VNETVSPSPEDYAPPAGRRFMPINRAPEPTSPNAITTVQYNPPAPSNVPLIDANWQSASTTVRATTPAEAVTISLPVAPRIIENPDEYQAPEGRTIVYREETRATSSTVATVPVEYQPPVGTGFVFIDNPPIQRTDMNIPVMSAPVQASVWTPPVVVETPRPIGQIITLDGN